MCKIKFNIAVEKLRNYEVLINDSDNTELLNDLINTAFNQENLLLGYGKCYYREKTLTFDSWVNRSVIPNDMKSFNLSDVCCKKDYKYFLNKFLNLIKL